MAYNNPIAASARRPLCSRLTASIITASDPEYNCIAILARIEQSTICRRLRRRCGRHRIRPASICIWALELHLASMAHGISTAGAATDFEASGLPTHRASLCWCSPTTIQLPTTGGGEGP